jgi:hypothetical protein
MTLQALTDGGNDQFTTGLGNVAGFSLPRRTHSSPSGLHLGHAGAAKARMSIALSIFFFWEKQTSGHSLWLKTMGVRTLSGLSARMTQLTPFAKRILLYNIWHIYARVFGC